MSESSVKTKYDIEYAKTKLKHVPLDIPKENSYIVILSKKDVLL